MQYKPILSCNMLDKLNATTYLTRVKKFQVSRSSTRTTFLLLV